MSHKFPGESIFLSCSFKPGDLNFEIYAYCFMSNHVHMVLKEKNFGDISLIMKRILTKYARWYNIKYGRSGALIANRYKSVPVEIDEEPLGDVHFLASKY